MAPLHRADRSPVQQAPGGPADVAVTYEPTLDTCARKVVAVHASAVSLRVPAAASDVARQAAYSSLADGVLQSSVREVAAYNALPRSRRVAVSLDTSAHALSDRSLPRRLVASLAEHGMNATQMTLCVTQEALPPDPRRAHAIAASIRATGCRLAVRAFAFEPGSLEQLLRIPMDALRLDHAFVATVDSDLERAREIRRLLRFADGIGVAVVAEGVERLTQYEHLRSLGCRYIQGPLAGLSGPLREAARAVVPGMPVMTVDRPQRTVA